MEGLALVSPDAPSSKTSVSDARSHSGSKATATTLSLEAKLADMAEQLLLKQTQLDQLTTEKYSLRSVLCCDVL